MKNFSVKNENAGVTTIVVVCAMAIIMALSLGLFLTASVLMKTAEKSTAGEQCRILAVSFSQEIERQLTGKQYQYEGQTDEASAEAQNIHTTSLWHYVKQNISDGSWPYYEEGGAPLNNRENAMRSFAMESSSIADEIADTELTLYWMPGEKSNRPGQLVVVTRVTVKEQSCSMTDTYELQITGDGYEVWTWEHVDKK